ncbi:type II toxin-antitoxin system PemK/MazF family toxin [Pedobacter sp. MR2016-19]|uniref:type II toxin-antitoxin system PemK/MazF family toxin n=1 Tax=Pedobacter sp. MR2016-19 TaxID=2780089 RepID=UPI0018758B84|nr:type II toxin-antitoxin system PemK/MazF family toxin [Pedobacter sp. MR2016-19]MBE5322116.1 type II toxin-antitoxin system PemK/MazF family toxin [Pedobacter sp. MR2016-19]
MPAYKRGDVLLVYFPFQDNPNESKKRPAVLLEDAIDDHLVVKCTKTDKSKYGPCIFIDKGTKNYNEMGLWEPTYISIGETVELTKYEIHSYLGECPEELIDKINELYQEYKKDN